jgi:hypothetical protein
MMVIFTPWILLWGFWFWGIFLIESVLLIYCLEEDKAGFAVFTTLVVVVLFAVWSDFWSFKWIFANPGSIFLFLLGYAFIGAVYSILKYFFYLTDKRRRWDKAFTEYCERIADLKGADKLKFSELPDGHKKGASDHIQNRLGYSSLPRFTESTRQVVFWMSYWPWSLFWTLLNNPIRWFFEEIKSGLIGVYRGMHSKIIGDRYDAMNEWKDK